MDKIRVNILDGKDLLRMKVIAVDTSFMATEYGGEFTRAKDLADIDRLMKRRNMSLVDLEIETYKYVISEKTYEIIDEYLRTKDISKFFSEPTPPTHQSKDVAR